MQRDRKASTSYLQRGLSMGHHRAATPCPPKRKARRRIIEKMEKAGIISEANAAGKRDILVDVVED